MIRCAFVDKRITFGYVNGANYIQKAFDTKIAKYALPVALSLPPPYEV